MACPRVRVIHWLRLFGRLFIWSQHQGLRHHAFYLNGRRTMYVAGVSPHPFKVYAGRAW